MVTKQRHLPFGPEKLVPFTEGLFDREEVKAARILWSILETRSPRKSDWSQVFGDSSEGANYRTIDRALPKLDAKSLLNIEKVMSKGRVQLEATLALVLLAYGLASMIGEAARDEAYGGGDEKGGCREAGGGSGSSFTRGSSFC